MRWALSDGGELPFELYACALLSMRLGFWQPAVGPELAVLALRVGAGVQRRGAPAALMNLTGLFGDRLGFLTPEHPSPVEGPALGLGLTLAPARFTLGNTQVSLLELGVGLGTDRPGLGLLYGLTLLEVSVAL
jgi:hypothetical protein